LPAGHTAATTTAASQRPSAFLPDCSVGTFVRRFQRRLPGHDAARSGCRPGPAAAGYAIMMDSVAFVAEL